MSARPTPLTLLAALAVLAGLGAAWILGARQEVAPRAAGPGWSLVDRHDRPRSLAAKDEGLVLAPGDRLRVPAPDGDAGLARLALRARPHGDQSSQLELRLGDGRRDGLVLSLVPGTPAELFLTRAADGGPQELARATVAEGSADPLTLELVASAEGLGVGLDGTSRLSLADVAPPAGAELTLWADGLVVDELLVERPGHEPVRASADDLAGEGLLPAGPAGLGLGLAALLLALALVSALADVARRRATPRELVTAALSLAAPPALVAVLAALRPGADPAASLLLGLAALLPGLALALPPLLRGRPEALDGEQGVLRPLLLALTLVLACGLVLADAGRSAIQPVLDRVDASRSDLTEDDWVLPGPVELTRANALSVPGRRYGLELEADVTLERRSLLELRLRGADRLAAGMAFVLSTHPEVPSGFVIERDTDFGLAGRPEAPVASGRRKHLRIIADGSRFAAFLDGQRFASAYLLDAPAGTLTALAPTGTATVHELTVRPILPGVPLPAPGGYALRAALKPLLMVILAAVLAQHLLRRRLVDLLALLALALVPAAVVVTHAEPDGSLAQVPWLLALAATLPLTLLPLVAAPADIGRGRRLAFAGVALAVALGLVTAPLGPPARAGRANGPELEDFAGPRLVPGLVHWQHPLVRRFNTWLVAHRYRGREVALPKPDDLLRVVAVGSSSTWGHGLPEGSGLAWPARLEGLLREALPGRRVEVVNGAVRGSTTGRMQFVLEEVLLELEPDLVVACFGYNDAGSITVADERAWLETFSEVGYDHDLLARLERQHERERGERLLARVWAHHERLGRNTDEAWERVAPEDAESPRVRYERNLRALVSASRQAGADVLLVPEAVADDGRRLWRRAFAEVMRTVAASSAAVISDPAPALQEQGGPALFLDEVHLRPEGHAAQARALLPAVLELLRAR